ncbi:hypothetical protein [Rhodococcus sp. IEGM 1408]|uniref:hypothetical protein n=1 Tax=Rhodococcus sp. IEGM 1408 TaxID=3082220 RepID=UPI0029529AED|nr:hypothetical protein [Rhodococcus sp. IEGM 1408]MDV8001811.1 hypothetical protein [Rhodococcus sp. IEGM 1408]
MTEEPRHAHVQPLDQAVAVTLRALKRSAPVRGLLDLPPFDQSFGDLSIDARREIVLQQLPVPIPLPQQPAAAPTAVPRSRPRRVRGVALWSLFALVVATSPVPAASLALGVLWLIVLLWPSRTAVEDLSSPTSARADSAGLANALELRIVWMARWQVAAILQGRAWRSDELHHDVTRIGLAEVLDCLTERALNVYGFSSTALPEPPGSQSELRLQWLREAERVHLAQTDLIEQLAALMVYRKQLDHISVLLDQRDQMAIYSARAAAFDDILSPPSDTPSLLDATVAQHDLQSNLAAQIRFLGQIADGSGTAAPLHDALYGPRQPPGQTGSSAGSAAPADEGSSRRSDDMLK